MNITTSQKIWSYPTHLRVVHQANEIIEREAGPLSGSLAVFWSLVAAPGGKSALIQQLTVVDAASPEKPFAFSDVTDLQTLRQEFRKWCHKDDSRG